MGCLAQVTNCLSSTLEHLGVYEPVIDIDEAKNRLQIEKEYWEEYQGPEKYRGTAFEMNCAKIPPLPYFFQKAVAHLKSHDIEQGIAVDLGCGLNPRSFNLLEQGWKVFAVDHSDFTIKALEKKVSYMGKNWIQTGQLVLIHQSIEMFEYPETVHLITAMDSLPYCNPEKIQNIFLKAKNALLPKGIFVGSVFPYNDEPSANNMLRGIGAWMTTKNVVEAMIRSVDFPSWAVLEGRSPAGLAKQFHIFGEKETHHAEDFRKICEGLEDPVIEINPQLARLMSL